MVRAKFWVCSIEASKGVDGYTINLSPVTSGSEENSRFYHYTPMGSITLSTINEDATKQFTVGKEYYVDFIAA